MTMRSHGRSHRSGSNGGPVKAVIGTFDVALPAGRRCRVSSVRRDRAMPRSRFDSDHLRNP